MDEHQTLGICWIMMEVYPNLAIRLIMTEGCLILWYMVHHDGRVPKHWVNGGSKWTYAQHLVICWIMMDVDPKLGMWWFILDVYPQLSFA